MPTTVFISYIICTLFHYCKSEVLIWYLIRQKRPNRMMTCFLLVIQCYMTKLDVQGHICFFPYLYHGFIVYIPDEGMQIALTQDLLNVLQQFTNANGLCKVGDRKEQSESFCDSVGNQMQDLMPSKINLVDKRVYFNLVTQSNTPHSHTNTCACTSQGGKGCVIALPVLAAALAYFYLNCM